ncbi:amidohydrolase family protein [Phytoactinopolyspora alkaliphila]|uniref:amidohydrolase family protein n=1 Tax=Phytoactinopolyspora alkaliphila TaxID=1783498 RepID=UPI0031B57C04
MPDPDTRGSVETLLDELDRHQVERALVICARIGATAGPECRNDDNNDYVAAAVRRHPDRLVMAADVDSRWLPEHHTSGAAARLRETATRYGISAFTHYVGDEDDGWLTTDDGTEFFAAAADLGLIASLAVTPSWFGAVGHIARLLPGLPILLHHSGLVRLWSSSFEDDIRTLLELAEAPNVFVKVPGFHYLSRPSFEYPFPEACTRVLRPLADTFGAHRLIWGSDFPVAQSHLTYRQSLALVQDHTPFWTDAERSQVMGATLEGLLARRL